MNKPGEDVLLLLGAYEPTIWSIGWSQGTRIAAVVVSGYHRQVVAGLPATVPVLNSSYDNRGPCGYVYVGKDSLEELNPFAQKVFGRRISLVQLAQNGYVFIGAPTTQLVTSDRVKPESFFDQTAPLAGPAGLADAVRRGLLREARAADMAAWRAAYRRAQQRDLPPVAGLPDARSDDSGRLFNTYVVLAAMQIPAGLYGAHSATFIVPKGVPRPTGNPGHSEILDHNTLTCVGATCGMRN